MVRVRFSQEKGVGALKKLKSTLKYIKHEPEFTESFHFKQFIAKSRQHQHRGCWVEHRQCGFKQLHAQWRAVFGVFRTNDAPRVQSKEHEQPPRPTRSKRTSSGSGFQRQLTDSFQHPFGSWTLRFKHMGLHPSFARLAKPSFFFQPKLLGSELAKLLGQQRIRSFKRELFCWKWEFEQLLISQ